LFLSIDYSQYFLLVDKSVVIGEQGLPPDDVHNSLSVVYMLHFEPHLLSNVLYERWPERNCQLELMAGWVCTVRTVLLVWYGGACYLRDAVLGPLQKDWTFAEQNHRQVIPAQNASCLLDLDVVDRCPRNFRNVVLVGVKTNSLINSEVSDRLTGVLGGPSFPLDDSLDRLYDQDEQMRQDWIFVTE
jgi:hypothetical protein